jgi:membrane protease subunit HflC
MQRLLVISGIAAAVVLLILANAFYVVPVDQQAIVLRFGQAQYTVNATEAGMSEKGPMQNLEAGLHLKVPLVDDVRYYDKRNMGYDLQADEIIAADQQRLNVDAIARWRIKNPLQYFRAAGGNGEQQLGLRFTAALRGELGKVGGVEGLGSHGNSRAVNGLQGQGRGADRSTHPAPYHHRADQDPRP